MNEDPTSRAIPTRENGYLREHAALLAESYQRWTGKPLLEDASDEHLGSEMFFSPLVIASHDTQADPIFNYANVSALKLWETDWESFTKMPSRHSASEEDRAAREAFMSSVTAQGYADGYSGVRVSALGRRFRILEATVWNVVDADGRFHGQAVRIARWEFLD